MEHFYQNIDGWFSYDYIYKYAVGHFPSGSRFVEIGSFKGRSSAFLAVDIINSTKIITLDLIDTWEGSTEHKLGGDCEVPEVVNGTLFETFVNNMKPVEGHYNAIRLPSVEAAKLYPDQSIDFVLIDGDHTVEAVRADISAFLPKMKRGGLMAGDDAWEGTGANIAAKELLQKYNVQFTGIHFMAWIN